MIKISILYPNNKGARFLVIRVFDEQYLERAKNLANDYTELSQKQVEIIKEY